MKNLSGSFFNDNKQQRRLNLFYLLTLLLLLTACAKQGAPPTLKIGIVAPFEGLHRPLGYEALFAVKLAVQEKNAQGGINGHQIELVALNDFDDPLTAQTQAKALVADPDVLGVIGHLSANATQAAMPIYQAANLAMVIPWSVWPVDTQPGGGVVSVAADKMATAARLDALSREQGLTSVTVSEFSVDALPSNNESQSLILDTDAVTAGEILLALEEAGNSLPVLGQVDVGSPQLPPVAQDAASGLVYVSPSESPTDISAADSFIDAYQALAGFSPGPRAVLAYDAANILFKSIEQSASRQNLPSRYHVSNAVAKVAWQGLSGDIVFDARGQRVNAPVWVYQISEEGQYPGTLLGP